AGELRIDPEAGGETVHFDTLLDELRLEGGSYSRARQAAALRLLALGEARRHKKVVTEEGFRLTSTAFRRERGLLTAEEMRHWLEAHYLSEDDFTRLIEE